jgi:hypothetical protein
VPEAHRHIEASVGTAVPGGAAAWSSDAAAGSSPRWVACLPDADHDSWGAPFGHCDGARLAFNWSRFVSI